MKIRFFALTALCSLALAASCQKAEEIAVKAGTATITAVVDEQTRTAYQNETSFSWVSDDRIFVLVSNTEDGRIDHFSYYAAGSGPRVDFTGTAFGPGTDFSVWESTGYALYPSTLSRSGSKDAISVILPDSYTVTGSDFMSIIPLVGTRDADNASLYRFKTATGVLKLTFANVPALAARLVLHANGNAVSGTFPLNSVSTVNGLQMSDAESGSSTVAVNFPVQAAGSTFSVYVPVPAGELSAGAYFSLQREDGTELYATPATVRAVTVRRNYVKNITSEPIVVPAPSVSLDNLLGEYQMTVYSAGPYSDGYAEPGDIVLEASDNSLLGNVMMTKFAGISGKQYGTFDGTYLVFPKDQIFGTNTIPNPSVDASKWPLLALDFYKETVVDACFELIGEGKIKAVNADAVGFRACTEDSWLNDSHGGSWPWALCFSTLTAEWKSKVNTGYVKGERIFLTSGMISASDVCTHDGGGIPALIDGDASTFWHSNYWYRVQANDPEYGIYFDLALAQAIDAIRFRYLVREGNANGRPTAIVYGVSNDGVSWTRAGGCSDAVMSDAGAGTWVELPSVSLGGSYSYIRLGIVDSADTQPGSFTEDLTAEGSALATDGDYHKSTNLAELELYWAE